MPGGHYGKPIQGREMEERKIWTGERGRSKEVSVVDLNSLLATGVQGDIQAWAIANGHIRGFGAAKETNVDVCGSCCH